VNELEDAAVMAEDTAEGDNARSAYDNARKWRARVESGE
jgi:hypothetical protein